MTIIMTVATSPSIFEGLAKGFPSSRLTSQRQVTDPEDPGIVPLWQGSKPILGLVLGTEFHNGTMSGPVGRSSDAWSRLPVSGRATFVCVVWRRCSMTAPRARLQSCRKAKFWRLQLPRGS